MWLALFFSLSSPCVSWRADIVEVNHVVDCSGQETLCQVIWWAWRPADDYHILAWRLTRVCDEPFQTAEGWVTRWQEKGQVYETTARFRIETWTPYDPEIVDRAWVNSDRRTEWRLNRGE